MARAINPEGYRGLIDSIRSRIPEIAITTDILTGFPGESGEEFEEGLAFIKEMEFAGGHVFTFSPREGTPAADFPDQVPHYLRKTRSAEIRTVLDSDRKSEIHPSLLERLSGITAHFEEEHPALTEASGRVVHALGQLGN